MAKKSNTKLFSIILIVVGAGVAFFGYQQSQGVGSQLTNAFSGSYSNEVMIMLISGGVCLVAGLYLFFKK